MKESPRSRYVKMVTGAALNVVHGEPISSVVDTIERIEAQAMSDFHLTDRDAEVVIECVESFVLFFNFMEEHDGGDLKSDTAAGVGAA